MPEGPETKRAADQLGKVLAGQKLTQVQFAFTHLQAYEAQLTGRVVEAVTSRGKALLTRIDNGLTIYSHNQLYGHWVVVKGRAPKATARQLRLALHTATHTALLYSASEIEVWSTADLARQPYLTRLGVELLDPMTTVADVRHQIDDARFARRSLAALLLDQGFLAGVGNYLRSEILFVARLAPDVRILHLNDAQRNALAHAAMALTWQSYRSKGITSDLELARRLKQQGWRFGQYRHWVFARPDTPCHVCMTAIRKIELSGRGLYYCPSCQRQSVPDPELWLSAQVKSL